MRGAPANGLAVPQSGLQREHLAGAQHSLADMQPLLAINLAEFTALRAEIVERLGELERTYTYLLVTIAAVSGGQLVIHLRPAEVRSHAYILLIVALTSLWFPAHITHTNVSMILAGRYLRDILGPRIEVLVNDALETEAARPAIRVLTWETDGPADRYATAFRRWILYVLAVFRSLILYVPCLSLTAAFFAFHVKVDLKAMVLLALIMTVLFLSLLAMFTLGSMTRHGRKAHML